eukprot:6575534-Prymnesium_polylepis.1
MYQLDRRRDPQVLYSCHEPYARPGVILTATTSQLSCARRTEVTAHGTITQQSARHRIRAMPQTISSTLSPGCECDCNLYSPQIRPKT